MIVGGPQLFSHAKRWRAEATRHLVEQYLNRVVPTRPPKAASDEEKKKVAAGGPFFFSFQYSFFKTKKSGGGNYFISPGAAGEFFLELHILSD